MATVILDRGGPLASFVLPAGLTLRQAATVIADQTEQFLWWHGDWRLLANRGAPTERPKAGLQAEILDPEVAVERIDGYIVVLGWIDRPETWN